MRNRFFEKIAKNRISHEKIYAFHPQSLRMEYFQKIEYNVAI